MVARVGIKPHQLGATYDEVARAWWEAEAAGFESIWVFDHLQPVAAGGTCLEGWTLLTALAVQTPRVRCGVMVAGVGYRHPALLATMAATLDVITGGRLELGLGAGSSPFGRADCEAYGLPFPPLPDRVRMLDETCTVLRRLWTEEAVDLDGRWVRLREARSGARPIQQPHPPLIIGGQSDRMLDVVASHAQGWNYAGADPDEFAERSRALDERCRSAGRDPTSIERSVQIFLRAVPEGDRVSLLRRFVAAGAGRIILVPDPPYVAGAMSRLAEQIMPALAQAGVSNHVSGDGPSFPDVRPSYE
jgi:alkanesulfonate monooxygenase SsuD/methylene tetrahydromethanopterin reductase-like flavin-dependent oxidoreductase (luciferase family)